MRPRPQRVVIADDCDDIRELWRVWLTHWGFEVVEASNGLEAVTQVRSVLPDLVLMDMWMPVMDGLDAVEAIRASEATAGVPIVALSAHVLPPAPQNALDAGCDLFLPKPVEPEVLLSEIRHVFQRLSARPGAA